MGSKPNWWARWSVLVSLAFSLDIAMAQSCDSRLLVSGYYSNVHVYDACTGAHLRKLDESSRLSGAQALKIGPDGRLWVVSEGAGTLLRYDARTLDYVDTFADTGAGFGLTGFAFAGDDAVYLGGYNTSTLRRYSISSGQELPPPPAPAVTVLKGPDNGMITANGQIYIPGYDTSNVVRFNPADNSYSQFVASRADGIRATRGLLISPDGTKMYVTGERSGQVLRYRFPGGGLDKVIATGLNTPTGMAWHPDGSLLVALASSVVKLDPETGAQRSVIVAAGSGGLSGATYVAVIPAAGGGPAPDPALIGSQYWLTALGRLSGTQVELEANTALGTAFGAAFNPADVRKPRWGKLRLNFTSCTEAEFSWQSSGANTANFGDGGYRIVRNLSNPAVADCQRSGIAGAASSLWLAGSWYGGPSRDGEGMLLDTDGNGLVFLTWFTYRPVIQ